MEHITITTHHVEQREFPIEKKNKHISEWERKREPNATDEDHNDKLPVIKCSLKFRSEVICAFVEKISYDTKRFDFLIKCLYLIYMKLVWLCWQQAACAWIYDRIFSTRACIGRKYLENGGYVECGPRHLRRRTTYNYTKCATAVKQVEFSSLRAPIRFCFIARTNRKRMPTSFTFTFVQFNVIAIHLADGMWILHFQLDLLTPFNLTQQFNSIYSDDVTMHYMIKWILL